MDIIIDDILYLNLDIVKCYTLEYNTNSITIQHIEYVPFLNSIDENHIFIAQYMNKYLLILESIVYYNTKNTSEDIFITHLNKVKIKDISRKIKIDNFLSDS